MSEEFSVTINIGPGRDLTLSAGKLAQLANGSCTVRQGDTIVFSAACSGEAKKGIPANDASGRNSLPGSATAIKRATGIRISEATSVVG